MINAEATPETIPPFWYVGKGAVQAKGYCRVDREPEQQIEPGERELDDIQQDKTADRCCYGKERSYYDMPVFDNVRRHEEIEERGDDHHAEEHKIHTCTPLPCVR